MDYDLVWLITLSMKTRDFTTSFSGEDAFHCGASEMAGIRGEIWRKKTQWILPLVRRNIDMENNV